MLSPDMQQRVAVERTIRGWLRYCTEPNMKGTPSRQLFENFRAYLEAVQASSQTVHSSARLPDETVHETMHSARLEADQTLHGAWLSAGLTVHSGVFGETAWGRTLTALGHPARRSAAGKVRPLALVQGRHPNPAPPYSQVNPSVSVDPDGFDVEKIDNAYATELLNKVHGLPRTMHILQ